MNWLWYYRLTLAWVVLMSTLTVALLIKGMAS